VAFSTKIYCKLTVEYACKNFKTSQRLAKLQATKSYALWVPGHWPAERRRTRQISWIWHGCC